MCQRLPGAGGRFHVPHDVAESARRRQGPPAGQAARRLGHDPGVVAGPEHQRPDAVPDVPWLPLAPVERLAGRPCLLRASLFGASLGLRAQA